MYGLTRFFKEMEVYGVTFPNDLEDVRFPLEGLRRTVITYTMTCIGNPMKSSVAYSSHVS